MPSQLSPDSARNRLIGIGLLSAAVFWFAVLDTAAKWLIPTLPLAQIVFLRFLGHVVFTAAAIGPTLGVQLVRTRHPFLQLIRGLLLPILGIAS